MKIGCAAWCFTHPHYAPPYEDAIKTIGRLGLQGLELIAFTIDDLQTYYTKARVKELRKLYSGYGLMLSEFVLYSYLVEGLLGKDPIVKTKAMDVFKKGLEISQDLGATIINMVSNWPPELKAPIAYPPTYIHPNVNGVQLFDPKLRMDLPANFNAPEVWNTYVDSLARMVELASRRERASRLRGTRRSSWEPRTHSSGQPTGFQALLSGRIWMWRGSSCRGSTSPGPSTSCGSAFSTST